MDKGRSKKRRKSEKAKEKLNKSLGNIKNFIQTTFPFHSPIPLTALRAQKRETIASIFHFFSDFFISFSFSHQRHEQSQLRARTGNVIYQIPDERGFLFLLSCTLLNGKKKIFQVTQQMAP